MPSTSYSANERLLLYYGRDGIDSLVRFRRVVLQPTHYRPDEVDAVASAGTVPLAYLALSEDPGGPAPWQVAERNEAWGTSYVDVRHPEWRRYVIDQAEHAYACGFRGLFLDTLDLPPSLTEAAPALVELVAELRALDKTAYLIANRGFGSHMRLAPYVDAFHFEAFSTTWADGYRPLAPRELLENVRLLHELQATGREVFALDYADRPELAAFARSRAFAQGLPLQVTNREVTALPAEPTFDHRAPAADVTGTG